ncbi:MAG: PaaI family thioesterase [Anaerolineae bacterium]
MSHISRFPGTPLMVNPPPVGFSLRFYVADDHSVYAQVTFDQSKEGGHGILHGGAIATVLDEAMGTASFESGNAGYTATMTYTYLAHIPLHQRITVRAWVERVDGKKVFTRSEALLPDDTLAVKGEALFITSDKLQKMVQSNPYIPEDEC